MPAARPEFRAALKASFVGGVTSAETTEAGASPHALEGHWKQALSVENERSSKVTPGPRRASRRATPVSSGPLASGPFSWQVATGLLAVAAAVVLLITGGQREEEFREVSSWSVAARGAEVGVGSERLSSADPTQIATALNGGQSLSSLDGFVEVQLASLFRIGMEPASRLDFPKRETSVPEGAEVANPEELYFRLTEGSLHLMTASDAPAQSIVIETPHARVRIRGSLLSIEVFEGKGTCICVAKGEAEVEVLSGSSDNMRVNGDSTCFVFNGEDAPRHGPSNELVSDDHLANLLEFYDETF